MLGNSISDVSIVPQQQEAQSIKQLELVLKLAGYQAKLIGPNGEQIAIR